MRYRIAPNVDAASLRDAARLAVPARRLLSRSRIRRVAAAPTDEARDVETRRWSAELLEALDVRLRLTGLTHIEAHETYLVLSLHEGLVDVPLLLQLPVQMTFVARADLAKEQPMDRLLEASRQILINPESPSALRVVLREARRLCGQGRSTVMFPQGSVLGVETSFQQGALVVARRLDLPVLPVVIAGSHRIWEHPFLSLVRRRQPVHMEILAPRPIGTPREYRDLEREMKRRAVENTWAPPRRYVPEHDGYWDGYRFDIDPDFAALAEQVARHRREVDAVGMPRATRTA
jgi:1-acyl-sn-glycerol-3-phosphate acyltransferase